MSMNSHNIGVRMKEEKYTEAGSQTAMLFEFLSRSSMSCMKRCYSYNESDTLNGTEI